MVAKDLRCQTLSLFNAIVRQLTVQAVLESCAGWFKEDDGRLFGLGRQEEMRNDGMDASILVDAIVAALGDSCKDFW